MRRIAYTLFFFGFTQAQSQIFERQGNNHWYNYKISPLLGVIQRQATAMEFGICSEFYRGRDVWHTKTKYCHFFAQSLSAEILTQSKPEVLPKYSFWFHSSKLFIFSFGSSVLYRKENGLFIRPECGVIFPSDRERGVFGLRDLKLKLAYGYSFTLNTSVPLNYSCISLIIYFGNNIGNVLALK